MLQGRLLAIASNYFEDEPEFQQLLDSTLQPDGAHVAVAVPQAQSASDFTASEHVPDDDVTVPEPVTGASLPGPVTAVGSSAGPRVRLSRMSAARATQNMAERMEGIQGALEKIAESSDRGNSLLAEFLSFARER